MSTPPRSTRRRTTSSTTLAVRHDARAWGVFFVLALMLLASVPLVGQARAQIPGLPALPPPIGGGASEEPTDPPSEEGPSAPALPIAPAEASADGLKTAYYTAANSDLAPNTLISEFPPGVVCILAPEFCGDGPNELTDPIQGAVVGGTDGIDSATSGQQQPVPPGTLPVGVLSGNPRYTSALGILLPEVGDNQSFSEFLVTLQMSDMSFAVESPAFRALATAVLEQAGANSGPEAFQRFFDGLSSGETDLFTPDFAGLEMCVIKTPWDRGDNQPKSVEPEIDPLFCSAAAKPDESGVVTFDMTFPANDSLPEGFVPGWEGVLVRPLGSQNLAYGDADYTTNYYAFFENPDEFPPMVATTVVDGPPPPVPTTPGGQNTGSAPVSSGGGGSSGSSFPSGGGGSSRPGSSGGSSVAASPVLSNPGAPGGADVGATLETPVAESAENGQIGGPTAAAPLDSTPVDMSSSGWIPWILLPMLLGGGLWYGRVLEGGPIEAVSRSGAMTRLLRERGFQM